MIRRLGALMMILALVLCTGPAAAGAEAPETLDINGLKIRPGMTAFSTLKGRQEPRYARACWPWTWGTTTSAT